MNKIFKKKLHRCIRTDKSESMEALRYAFYAGLGSILCGIIDLFWVIMDMIYMFHPHHIVVFIGLSIASGTMIYSFVFLWRCVVKHIEDASKPKRKYTRKKK